MNEFQQTMLEAANLLNGGFLQREHCAHHFYPFESRMHHAKMGT